ncbi:MAG: Bug family tripartite tricarboxylate transporter substrate binding protein [Burkholderiales bacterium]
MPEPVFKRASGLALCVMGSLFCAGAAAQTKDAAFPTKPLRLIVPYFPGGTPDIQGRMIADRLKARFGQLVIVDNRPGANGSIGMGLVARAPADGHTFVIAPVGPWAVNPHLYKLPYDVLTDFAPVIHVAATPGVLVVHPSIPAKNVKELIALARKHPGDLNYGSTGVGGFGHMCGELFTAMAKVKMTHVPHKSQAAALTDVMGGHIQVLFNVATPAIPHIRSGKIRGLATTGRTRMEVLPQLPTIDEAGVPGYENTTWNGIGAPAKTPQPIIDLLNREMRDVLQLPEVKEIARADGATITATTPEQFGRYLKSEYDKFAKLVKEAGIKPAVE